MAGYALDPSGVLAKGATHARDELTRAGAVARGRIPQYFRHPFLHVGADLETRRAFDAFLTRYGYTVAPSG